jgi:2-aminomuconate deaminase
MVASADLRPDVAALPFLFAFEPDPMVTESQVLAGRAAPRGKYPHFRRAGDFIFVSGTSARRADDTIAGAAADAHGAVQFDIRAQTRAVLENVAGILGAAGATLADVVEVVAFLTDMGDFAGYNEVYGEFFGYDGPARTTVAVRELPHPHLRIEIKAVAYKPRGGVA